MKVLVSFFLSILFLTSYGNNATYKKLAEVNKCWADQPDVTPAMLPGYAALSEREWIRTHLSLVEGILSNRNTDHLSSAQKHNRAKCLSLLHGYWLSGNFPVNEDYATRTPIFIDKHDNFCAVGYLVKATGNEQVSRMIAAKTNLAYVKEMNYPELTAWAADNGFTVDELAWIQPGYSSGYTNTYCVKIGNGVNGYVNELFADDTSGKLYVGGQFTEVDGGIPSSNVAFVTEAGGVYSWHNMTGGVNGPVYAIANYQGKIFVGGSFSMAGSTSVANVAYWEGGTWHSAGCVSGTVRDLVVFQGSLYACGDFDDCVLSTSANFAKWDGSNWQSIAGINGRINTMEVVDTSLFMGGAFTYATATNIVRWSMAGSFQSFPNGVANEVRDIQMHILSILYISCEKTSATDTTIIHYWYGDDSLHPANLYMGVFHQLRNQFAINTMLSNSPILRIGGIFTRMSNSELGCIDGGEDGSPSVDSAVNKMVLFKGALIFGGSFRNGNDSVPGTSILVNGIATKAAKWIPQTVFDFAKTKAFSIYPNPATNNSMLHLENNFNASRYTLHHITGKLHEAGVLDKTQQITLGSLSPGIYIIALTNDAGERVMQKIAVQ